jgi:hypothetical protein
MAKVRSCRGPPSPVKILTTASYIPAFPVSLNGGMITVPVPPNMYQQMVTNMQSGESPGIQVIGSPHHHLLTVGGNTILAKLESPEHAVALGAPRGLTITPVVSTSSSSAGSVIHVRLRR